MKTELVMISSILIFLGCNNQPQQTNPESGSHNGHEHADSDNSDDLKLNNGEKWQVNAEMKPYIAKGEELLTNYVTTKQTDYKALASQLQEQNQFLIRSCNMTGPSHDELHKWLHPYMELLDELSKTESAKEADELIGEIKESFQTYHAYFQ